MVMILPNKNDPKMMYDINGQYNFDLPEKNKKRYKMDYAGIPVPNIEKQHSY